MPTLLAAAASEQLKHLKSGRVKGTEPRRQDVGGGGATRSLGEHRDFPSRVRGGLLAEIKCCKI